MLRDRYDSGMTVKITVSLPDELVADARAAVEAGQAASVSAYVATAMRAHAERYTWQDFITEMDELHGPIPDEAYQWADGQLARVGTEPDAE
jgi:Arc/MetJ-type ribon-helix-helix transcriptional regulator